jgi:uncharacterized pyridoxal phosphate-containing UPF0001 family protein
MSFIKANLENIKERINQAAKACGRSPGDIQLLAVSKTFPAEDVRTCFQSGQRAFGENYVQEGVAKITSLQDLRAEIKWHFIGPLQSNKSRDAQRLNDQRPSNLQRLNVCIQVNISGESSKSGVQANDLIELCKHISGLPNLLLRGLMSIPEPTDDVVQQKQAHHELRQLLEILKSSEELDQSKMQLDTLSMGMSSDIEAAIAEGSTMVRVGTAIFGKRTYL